MEPTLLLSEDFKAYSKLKVENQYYNKYVALPLEMIIMHNDTGNCVQRLYCQKKFQTTGSDK